MSGWGVWYWIIEWALNITLSLYFMLYWITHLLNAQFEMRFSGPWSQSFLHRPLQFTTLYTSWVNSRSWWWTGRPGVLRFMGLQRVGHDWATELNWTESEGTDLPYSPPSIFVESNTVLCSREESWVHTHPLWWATFFPADQPGHGLVLVLLIRKARY